MTVTTRPKLGRRQRSETSAGTPTANDLAGRAEAANKERADRVAAVTDAIGLVELPLAALAAAEQVRLGPGEIGAFTLDIVTLDSHKPALATALVDLAESYPVLAAVLDRLAKATPFSALVSVVVSLGVQIAENHKSLPSAFRGLSPNLVDRDELVDRLTAQVQTAADEPTPASNGRRAKGEPAKV